MGNGTALSSSEITVTFGSVTRKVILGKSDKKWEVEFDLTQEEINALKSEPYPNIITAEGDRGGYKFQTQKNVVVKDESPSVSINSLGGDGIINISELEAGIKVSGTSNAFPDGKVTVK